MGRTLTQHDLKDGQQVKVRLATDADVHDRIGDIGIATARPFDSDLVHVKWVNPRKDQEHSVYFTWRFEVVEEPRTFGLATNENVAKRPGIRVRYSIEKLKCSAEVGATGWAFPYETDDRWIHITWDRSNGKCHNQSDGGYTADRFELLDDPNEFDAPKVVEIKLTLDALEVIDVIDAMIEGIEGEEALQDENAQLKAALDKRLYEIQILSKRVIELQGERDKYKRQFEYEFKNSVSLTERLAEVTKERKQLQNTLSVARKSIETLHNNLTMEKLAKTCPRQTMFEKDVEKVAKPHETYNRYR